MTFSGPQHSAWHMVSCYCGGSEMMILKTTQKKTELEKYEENQWSLGILVQLVNSIPQQKLVRWMFHTWVRGVKHG